MSRNLIRSLAIPVAVYTVEVDRLAKLSCRDCRSVFDLHQPDPSRPHELLGTCPNCGRWCRVDARESEGPATVMELPGIPEAPTPPRA